MLKIRLARIGKRKKPTYRFIVSESSRDVFGKALEILGYYNPFTKVCDVKKDRILYWISQGAKASPTVHNLLVDQNVIAVPKVKASKAGKKSAKAEAEVTVKPAAVPAEKPAEEAKTEKPKVKTEKPVEKTIEGNKEKVEEKAEEKKEKTAEKPAEKTKSAEVAAKSEEKPAEKSSKKAATTA